MSISNLVFSNNASWANIDIANGEIDHLTVGHHIGGGGMEFNNSIPKPYADFTNADVIGLVLPPSSLIPPQNTLYVAKNGIDGAPNNGSQQYPYASVSYALSQITGASPVNRWLISINSGNYSDNITILPNVCLQAENPLTVQFIGSNIDCNHPSWADGADNFCSFVNLQFDNTCTINFNLYALGALTGYITMFNCVCFCQIITALFDSASGFVLKGCSLIGGVLVNGGFIQMYDTVCPVGDIGIFSNIVTPTQAWLVNCTCANGNINSVHNLGDPAINLVLIRSLGQQLNLNGNITCNATSDSIPITKTIIGGATLQSLNNLNSLSDVNVTAPNAGDILQYNGTTFSNVPLDIQNNSFIPTFTYVNPLIGWSLNPLKCQYSKVNNMVTCTGKLEVTIPAGSVTGLIASMSLPFPLAIAPADINQITGVLNYWSVPQDFPVGNIESIIGDVNNVQLLQLNNITGVVGNAFLYFSFQYISA